ncbi:Protein hgh1 [Tilletia horrida]|uniref:Protein hgh1 n=1 Tax=Tilletia horrida TaxID=155126 RepID=A0AAN6JJ74_9BASI|nr:Protein hgh1 [Tilletia horrida]
MSAHLELLTFLSDPDNGQIRQLALEHVVGWSKQGLAERSLLTAPPGSHKSPDGKPLLGRDGKPVDSIRDLKALCKDQPLSAHNAFSALINLSDSALVARRIADADFLAFLVQYLADPVSLLGDLACMLLSNLTKVEAVSGILLDLQVPAQNYYSFHTSGSSSASAASKAHAAAVDDIDPQEAAEQAARLMDADPSAPNYDELRAEAEAYAKRIKEKFDQAQSQTQSSNPTAPAQANNAADKVSAMQKLLAAFDEGATVASGKGTADPDSLEAMKARVLEVAKETSAASSRKDGASRPAVTRKTNCNFLASVFANVTVLPKGREYFITPSPASAAQRASAYPVSRITAYTEHPDLIRRGGVISAMKNILFVKSAHSVLLAPPPVTSTSSESVRGAPFPRSRPSPYETLTDLELDVLPSLLLPLISGSELEKVDVDEQESLPTECQLIDPDKEREKDPALRLMLIECLLLLCTSLYGRQVLRCRGAYVVVREAHVREQDEKISESIHRLVDLLQRDESEATLKDGDAVDVGAERVEEDDDDDMVIEEL